MPNKIRVEAKDVSEAIAQGLKELGLRRDQVEVNVLENPKKGFLGIGSRPAVVEMHKKRWSSKNLDAQIYMDVPKRKTNRRSPRNGRGNNGNNNRRTSYHAPVEKERRERTPKANEPQLLPCEAIQNAVIPEKLKQPMQEAKDRLAQVLAHMGVKVENLNAWWDEKQQRILLTFDCDKPAIVIGKEGKTLEAIQYLSTLALSRHFDTPISVITDTQNYWRKTEDKINAEIERGIEMIKNGNSVFRFRPMSAQLRRYIHRAVEGNEYVTTTSEGEGKWRKVTFRPTEKVASLLNERKAPADFVPGVIGEDKPEEQPVETAQTTAEQPAEIVTVRETVVETPDYSLHEKSVEITAVPQVQETAQTETSATENATPAQTQASANAETEKPVTAETETVNK